MLSATLLLSCAVQAAPNILVFGDSLSAGYGIARNDSWVYLLQQELKKSHPRLEVVNASISGETSAGGVRRIGKALREHRPAVVIVELGANDGLRGTPLAATEQQLSTIIREAKQANAKVLLLGMQLPPNYGLEYAKNFRALYPRLAQQHRIALLPFMLEGVPPEQFLPDNLHPNAVAQSQILRNVLQALAPLL